MPNIEIDPQTGAPIIKTDDGNTPDAKGPDNPPTDFTVPSTDVPSTVDELKITTATDKPNEPEVSEQKSEKELLIEQMARIEHEAGGFSNIGMNSEYWDLRRKFQSLG